MVVCKSKQLVDSFSYNPGYWNCLVHYHPRELVVIYVKPLNNHVIFFQFNFKIVQTLQN